MKEERKIKNTKNTPVYGLVLAGGKSTRMGRDKGVIVYHQLPQRDYLYKMLNQFCERTFYGIRPEQLAEFSEEANLILDKNKYKGPFNGLLSAHEAYPEVAWLVMACDLPLMTNEAIKELLALRDANFVGTAFATRESGLPEPLAAIWEPHGLEKSKAYLDQGSSTCPRKYLIKSKTKLVFPKSGDHVLLNANSEEEYKEVLSRLASI